MPEKRKNNNKTDEEIIEADDTKAKAESPSPALVPSATVSSSNSLAVPISIVIAGVLVALSIVFTNGGLNSLAKNGSETETETPEGPTNEELLALAAIQPDDYIRGNPDSEVYILEFSDTECPFCKQFHETMKQVRAEYENEVAWVYRHFPLVQLHPTAPREAEALECAGELGGNDVFWAYADQIYELTPQGSAIPDSQLPVISVTVGLDATAFRECLDSGRFTAEVQKDLDNAVALGGRGTPHSLVISGDQIIPINGAQPFATVKATIDSLLRQ